MHIILNISHKCTHTHTLSYSKLQSMRTGTHKYAFTIHDCTNVGYSKLERVHKSDDDADEMMRFDIPSLCTCC